MRSSRAAPIGAARVVLPGVRSGMIAATTFAVMLLSTPAVSAHAEPEPPPPSPLERLAHVAIKDAEVIALDPAQPALLVTGKAGVYRIDLTPFPQLVAEPAWDLDCAPGESVSHVEVDPAGRGFAAATLIPKDFAAAPGRIVLFDPTTGNVFASVDVGYNPDCCKFSPGGTCLVVADEGQPQISKKSVIADPPGSISIIDLAAVRTPADLAGVTARTVEFTASLLAAGSGLDGLRIHPSRAADPILDLEPEYIAIAGQTAWITLQENNAIARLDLATRTVERLVALGEIGQTIDASDRDGGIHIRSTIAALPMPDQIAAFTVDGRGYLITANEGDDRGDADKSPLGDTERLSRLFKTGRLALDAVSATDLADDRLGRLHVCAYAGGTDGDQLIDRPAVPGSRSVSVWDAETLQLVADTGSAFETLMAQAAPTLFNTSEHAEDLDSRSDVRGPEPEGVAVLTVAGRTLAFVSLERPGAVALIDLAHPDAPTPLGLHVTAAEGDIGPEGIIAFDGARLGRPEPIIAAAFEKSGTVAVYRLVPR